MWGHHPTFGSDLLDGPFEITCGAADVSVEPQYDPPPTRCCPAPPGTGRMCRARMASSTSASPSPPWASLVYLQRFAGHWAAIRRLDDAIAVILSWDGERFPCAWLWCELDGTADEPWAGRTRLIGMEPNTTPCGLGLAESKRRGVPLLRLEPGRELTSDIQLRVFRPSGPILDPSTIINQRDHHEHRSRRLLLSLHAQGGGHWRRQPGCAGGPRDGRWR